MKYIRNKIQVLFEEIKERVENSLCGPWKECSKLDVKI
jgi:hypothetical protein